MTNTVTCWDTINEIGTVMPSCIVQDGFAVPPF